MKIQMQHQEGAAVYSARVFAAPLARAGVPLRCCRLMCSARNSSGVARMGGGAVWGYLTVPQPNFHGLFSSRGNDRGKTWCARRVGCARRLPVNWLRVPIRARGFFWLGAVAA
jgi:hypothetical protein